MKYVIFIVKISFWAAVFLSFISLLSRVNSKYGREHRGLFFFFQILKVNEKHQNLNQELEISVI